MDFDGVDGLIEEILRLVSEVPEEYRITTYEILLSHFLIGQGFVSPEPDIPEVELAAEPFLIPIDVRAALTQYDLDDSVLSKLFLMEGSEVRPIYILSTTQKARSQMQVACLSALENALRGGKFEFSVEAVRQKLQDLKVIDKANFNANFRNNKKMFKGLDDKEHVELSADGKAELAETILELVK